MEEDFSYSGTPRVGLGCDGYPNAGHWAFGPIKDLNGYDQRGLGKTEGTAAIDVAARNDQWPKLLDFLRRSLVPATDPRL